MRILLITVLLLIFNASTTYALEYDTTGAGLLKSCSHANFIIGAAEYTDKTGAGIDLSSDAFEGAAYCLGIIRGVTTVARLTAGLECVPNLSTDQHVKTVLEYLKSNDAAFKKGDVEVILEALLSKYKCN